MLLLTGGNGMVVVAEQHIPSGLAALLVAAVPLWLVLLRRAVGERVPVVTLIGVVVGLAGVALLLLPGGSGGPVSLGYSALVLGAALSWALGSMVAIRGDVPANPAAMSAIEMVAGGAVLAVIGAARGEFGGLDLGAFSTKSWLSLGYLIVFGSIVAFSCYVWVLGNAPTSLVATYAYVNPAVAVVLGVLLADEHLRAWRRRRLRHPRFGRRGGARRGGGTTTCSATSDEQLRRPVDQLVPRHPQITPEPRGQHLRQPAEQVRGGEATARRRGTARPGRELFRPGRRSGRRSCARRRPGGGEHGRGQRLDEHDAGPARVVGEELDRGARSRRAALARARPAPRPPPPRSPRQPRPITSSKTASSTSSVEAEALVVVALVQAGARRTARRPSAGRHRPADDVEGGGHAARPGAGRGAARPTRRRTSARRHSADSRSANLGNALARSGEVMSGYFAADSMAVRVMSTRAVGLTYGKRALVIGAVHPRLFVGTVASPV